MKKIMGEEDESRGDSELQAELLNTRGKRYLTKKVGIE